MPRKPRVEYSGAFYHVICRGNQRQVIFAAIPTENTTCNGSRHTANDMDLRCMHTC